MLNTPTEVRGHPSLLDDLLNTSRETVVDQTIKDMLPLPGDLTAINCKTAEAEVIMHTSLHPNVPSSELARATIFRFLQEKPSR